MASQLRQVTDGLKHLTTTSMRNALSVQLAIRNLKGNLFMPKVVVLIASHTLGKTNEQQQQIQTHERRKDAKANQREKRNKSKEDKGKKKREGKEKERNTN